MESDLIVRALREPNSEEFKITAAVRHGAAKAIEDLRSQVVSLRAALQPFADHAFALEQPHARHTPLPADTVVHWTEEGMSAVAHALRLCHFRNAADAFKEK